MYVVIETRSGLLEGVEVFRDREEALRRGQAAWGDAELGPNAEGEDIDPQWGGVARGYVMHWFDDDVDIWVVEAADQGNIERALTALDAIIAWDDAAQEYDLATLYNLPMLIDDARPATYQPKLRQQVMTVGQLTHVVGREGSGKTRLVEKEGSE